MASPHIAGLLAYILSFYPSETFDPGVVVWSPVAPTFSSWFACSLPVVDADTPFGKQLIWMAGKVEAAGQGMLSSQRPARSRESRSGALEREEGGNPTRHPLTQSEGISRPKGIYKASRHTITYSVYTSGKPLSIPDYRIEGHVFELVNELALVKLSCKYTIFNGEIRQLIMAVNLPSSHSKKNK